MKKSAEMLSILSMSGDAELNALRVKGGRPLWNYLAAEILKERLDAEMPNPYTIRVGSVLVERLTFRGGEVYIQISGPTHGALVPDWTTTPERLLAHIGACAEVGHE